MHRRPAIFFGVSALSATSLDISEHGMWGYPEAFMPVPGGVYRQPDTPTVNPHPVPEPVATSHKEVSPA